MSQIMLDTTMAALEKGLDGTAARQRATAANLANIETPGYQPQVVSFEEDLRRALVAERNVLSGADASPIAKVAPRITAPNAEPVRLDGNAVDLETEVATLGRNSLQHSALLRLMGKKLDMLRTALK